MDTVSLKEILNSPLGLLLLMFTATLLGGIKFIIVKKQEGIKVTMAEYLQYWPETSAAIVGNIIAFIVLVLTDQLNFASAIGIGYGVNSAADLLRTGGRSVSGTIITPKE